VTTVKSSWETERTTELTPSYTIPWVLILASLPGILVQPWVSLGISLFGLFLMIQTATIRLKFTEAALEVYRSGKLIRNFPYQDWLNWRIFWKPVPILFYFREVKSIHFLPIIFDAKTLEACLEKYCPLVK
jgi:hypothetical protein